jgi:hypothetical protein
MKIDIYLHSDKDSVYDKGQAAGLSEEALRKFMYTGYEVKMTYDVNAETGDSKLIAVDDITLGAKR